MGANTGAHGPPDELEPIGRFQWEQSLRMLALPWETKAFGLLLATYAAADGGRIHPGEEVLARDSGLSERTVRRHLEALRERYCLIERVSSGAAAGRRAGWSDVYRLVVPDDITDRVEVLLPKPTPARRRHLDTPSGMQPKLPIRDVDNSENTGHPRPVDNPIHRSPMSGDNERTPDTGDQNTGHPATEHRTLVTETPDTHDRSPVQGPLQDQNNDQNNRGHQPPQVQGETPPVDKPDVDNPPASMSWLAIANQARDAMAAAAANPRHARPTPPPIVRPDRE